MRRPLTLACALTALLGSSVSALSDAEAVGNTLQARVEQILGRRGQGADALGVIDNFIRHEEPAPRHAPPLVRELLARPLAAQDVAAIFERSVPAALRRLVAEASAAPSPIDGAPVPIQSLLAVYVDDLAIAQHVLRSAPRGTIFDTTPLLQELRGALPSAARLQPVAQALDTAALQRANDLFLDATARFIAILRTSAGRIRFPDQAVQYTSPVGLISIGSVGDDEHGPGAAIIIDPGGNDRYQRAPTGDGAISVIVDLGGNDHYRGSDVVLHGFSALLDFAGNDHYQMAGPGIGAAIAGASLLVDFSGNDRYDADVFGEGASAFGLGALIDLGGDDTYRVRAGGQGFGSVEGVGILWDWSGHDRYVAAGLSDAFDRGGGVSMAQGSGHGLRTSYGGGIGILRDDRGNDTYEAQMFAQGVAYWYGVGLLWDRAGEDRYGAVRYAQGSGVHEAVGVLRDESGNDRYELAVGVGQGMGLDLSVGILFDAAGDDDYLAPSLAQGSATANAVGLLIDQGGTNRWRMDAERRGWGHAEWLRGLPSLGLLLYEPASAVFERSGRVESLPPDAPALGGPLGGTPIVHESPPEPHCPARAATTNEAGDAVPLGAALRRLLPGLIAGQANAVLFESVRRRLTRQLRSSIAQLPADEFDMDYALNFALRCVLQQASSEESAPLWDELEALIAERAVPRLTGTFVAALRVRPPPAPQLGRVVRAVERDPSCSVRASALVLAETIAADADTRAALAFTAQAALRSSCWRMQAQALAVLGRLRVAPDAVTPLPSFLRARQHQH